AAAFVLPLAMAYAARHAVAVRRAGHAGSRLTLGANLFRAILSGHSGVVLSRHEFAETWSLVANADRRVHLAIPEMLGALQALHDAPDAAPTRPFILAAGERRSYNANQIYRDPAWRKGDRRGALRIHPDDARDLGMAEGETVRCESDRAALDVCLEFDDGLRRGVLALPHGYGMRYAGGEPLGPCINRLTGSDHCDPFTRTPYHKYVPVSLARRAVDVAA
ncbi:MAG: molybdopterin dinucleotide binding domain-containing protein, partial [Burkholderiales bacterium]